MRRGFGDAIEDDFAGLFADRRGKQGQDYLLGSILGLIVVSLLCGRRDMKALLQSWNDALSRDAD